jgi:Tex-like protein N-terminal domain
MCKVRHPSTWICNLLRIYAGKLTAELKTALETAETLLALEDLYLPFKRARCTHAETARAQGFGMYHAGVSIIASLALLYCFN